MKTDRAALIDPVRELIDEHVLFMSALEELVEVTGSIAVDGPRIEPATLASLQSLIDVVDEHLNVHFLKEEEIFFPAIEWLFPTARVKFQFLHVDHDRLRDTFELFFALVQSARHGRLERARFIELRKLASEMVRLFYFHIVAEDAVYLDVASEMLSADEASRLSVQMHALEERLREKVRTEGTEGTDGTAVG